MNEEMINALIEKMTMQYAQTNNNLLAVQIRLDYKEKELAEAQAMIASLEKELVEAQSAIDTSGKSDIGLSDGYNDE